MDRRTIALMASMLVLGGCAAAHRAEVGARESASLQEIRYPQPPEVLWQAVEAELAERGWPLLPENDGGWRSSTPRVVHDDRNMFGESCVSCMTTASLCSSDDRYEETITSTTWRAGVVEASDGRSTIEVLRRVVRTGPDGTESETRLPDVELAILRRVDPVRADALEREAQSR